jgi:predicted DNA-binding transcriptional regulator YafY
MARKRSNLSPAVAVTPERAARLYRLVSLLGKKPQSREQILHRLAVGVRDFYRDLNALQRHGISVALEGGKYQLTSGAKEAVTLLPFIIPEPGLTLGEAEQLARGQSAAHRKLGQFIKKFKAGAPARRRRRTASER